ncbi:MAG: heavy-metal-associated domain-containing protein [Candidatus Woesearchaeota archaeon]
MKQSNHTISARTDVPSKSTVLYIPDIECDSCVRRITKKLHALNITKFNISQDVLTITEEVNEKKVIETITALGYRVSTEPVERKTFFERIRHAKAHPQKYALELKGIVYSIGILTVLILAFTALYVGFLQNMSNGIQTYGWWLFYLIISVTTIAMALWHFYAYSSKVTCMIGMMIGMTFGMQTGMMIGFIIGATNGYFVGALSGMLLGVTVGFITGKCCGIMGVMEGMMAGVMGGTMGPMISVMMFSDNILIFTPFYIVINVLIMIGLSYMLYEEVVEGGKITGKNPLDFVTLASLCLIVFAGISMLIMYGPKSALLV